MRHGLNTLLISSGFSDADLHLIEEFKNYGAEVIELAIYDPSSVTPSKVLDALDKAMLPVPITCGIFGPGRDLRGSKEEVQNSVNYLNSLLQLAEKLNSKLICGPMYSSVGRTNSHSPEEREAQQEQIAKALKPLCEKAENMGITLAMEPLNRFETDCINTVDQAIELIQRVGRPNLKIHVDTFHMNIEENNSKASILRAAQHIGHFHASASHRGLLGQDQVHWAEVFSALHAINYQGDIVIESFSPENVTIAKAASIWRTLYHSPDELAVQGLEFIKQQSANARKSVNFASH
jgi:D-psicose/D-tagatose/L-ribulose 3-epimerase